jgi:lipopolysaccharide export system permease protein
MKRVDRYIFKTVTVTALVALLVLLTLELFFALLNELEDLDKANYGLYQMMQYLMLTTPKRIYLTFPPALLLGGLLGMGALASSNELVVMRAAGLSLLRLVGSALQAGLVLGLLALVLGEFVAPKTEFMAQKFRAEAKDKAVSIREGRGFWARNGNYFINVRAVLPGVRLKDIYVYEIDDRSDLRSAMWAEGAHYVDVDGRWVLEGVKRSIMRPERVMTDAIPSLVVDWTINPKLLEVLATDPKDLSMRDLLPYIDYLEKNGLEVKTYWQAFWVKVLTPLSNLAMLFIAMPFVFGSQRTASVGQRLVIGVFIGLLFFLANRMLGNLVLLYDWPPLLGAIMPSLVFFAAGTYALRRTG